MQKLLENLNYTPFIFPIVCDWALSWTWFYWIINNHPYIVTAKHVVDTTKTITIFHINPKTKEIVKIWIEKKHCFISSDIALLESTYQLNKNIGFIESQQLPNIWDYCHMIWYQWSIHKSNNYSLEINKYEWQIEEFYSNWTAILKNPCFQCSYNWMNGSSWAPVFNKDWELIGLHSTGFNWIEWLSFITPLPKNIS